MFAKSVIGSARFLRMPSTSRLLYYDLGMQADDDGVVEAFSVMRTTGVTEDDLRVLASKGFVSVLNDDLVTYITDWSRNNYIQKDRYHPSIYKEALVKLTDGSGMDTGCIQNVSGMDTQVRLELGEDSIRDSGAAKPTSPTPLPETNFGPELQSAFSDWLAYKQEKRQGYKPTGLKSLVTQVSKNVEQYGEAAVARLIRECMASNWQGIIWDKLKKESAQQQKDVKGDSFAEYF